jgi:hypothetical protein
MSSFAQNSSKFSSAEPLKKDGPQVFANEQTVKGDKSRLLVSVEEANKCLFNHLQIREAYSQIVSLRGFYSSHGADQLWKSTMKTIFSDRESPVGRDQCAAIAKLYPENIEPEALPKSNYHSVIKEKLGESIQSEFNFCLSYLGLEYLDKEIWDVYISKESDLIKEISDLTAVSDRMKGLMLATDFQTKVCYVGNGLNKSLK